MQIEERSGDASRIGQGIGRRFFRFSGKILSGTEKHVESSAAEKDESGREPYGPAFERKGKKRVVEPEPYGIELQQFLNQRAPFQRVVHRGEGIHCLSVQFGKTIIRLPVETLPDARTLRIVPIFSVLHGIFQIEQIFGKGPEAAGGKKFPSRIDGMSQRGFQSLRNPVLDGSGKPEPEGHPLFSLISGSDDWMNQRIPSSL